VTDRARFLIGILAAFVTFVLSLYAGAILAGAGLVLVLERVLGEEHAPRGILPFLILFAIILSCILTRYVFKKIIGVRPPLMTGTTMHDETRDRSDPG
jgi:CDP-diglyceride synthetase